ncbi:MAG: class I SAM-dependent methyltransferase [Bacteroidales bacterium]|nr:class I SAM-dependent methyltransferase [Bacteroidales bacterium]
MQKEFWDERFSVEEYIYGEEPSEWFRQIIDGMKPGRILIPGAGEGRDAVYAAKLGWEVYAFDQSEAGRNKAMKLAEKHKVAIHYIVTDAAEYDPGKNQFDLITMVFFHLPSDFRSDFHTKLIQWLRPGGTVLIEAFHLRQLNNTSGGPKNPDLLITANHLANDFKLIEITENLELTVELNEGTHHHGQAEVVRFTGIKRN